MKLTMYPKSKPYTNGRKSEVMHCNIARKRKSITFNCCAIRELGLENEQRIMFAQDITGGGWYFSLLDADEEPTGNKLYFDVQHGRVIYARCTNEEVSSGILNELALDSATYLIARNPTMIDGKKWYKILTKHPYKIYL